MASLWNWFQRPTANQLAEEAKRWAKEEEARRAAEFIALTTVVGLILEAMPTGSKAKVRAELRGLIAHHMSKLPVPPNVPQGYEQTYRDQFSLLAQMLLGGQTLQSYRR